MLRTITVGTTISIQGMFVRANPNGTIAVRDGGTVYTGRPVDKKAA